jgi:23S rRNA pseudouridine1911/1915/1917 synthase
VVVGDSVHDVACSAVIPAKGPLDIVYEDVDILVIDKPAGLVMHPGPGHYDDTLANRVRAHLEERGVRAGFHAVFRLDRDTSGLVVIATNAHAQDVLQRALHTPAFERSYLGIVADTPSAPMHAPAEGHSVQPISEIGMVYAPIAQSEDALNTYEVREDGKLARTRYERLETGIYGTLMRFHLETGRTHQIRVHMAYIGHPLIGDAHYGQPSDLIDRTALHSGHIDLVHPVSGRHLMFDSPLPPDMQALL